MIKSRVIGIAVFAWMLLLTACEGSPELVTASDAGAEISGERLKQAGCVGDGTSGYHLLEIHVAEGASNSNDGAAARPVGSLMRAQELADASSIHVWIRVALTTW